MRIQNPIMPPCDNLRTSLNRFVTENVEKHCDIMEILYFYRFHHFLFMADENESTRHKSFISFWRLRDSQKESYFRHSDEFLRQIYIGSSFSKRTRWLSAVPDMSVELEDFLVPHVLFSTRLELNFNLTSLKCTWNF